MMMFHGASGAVFVCDGLIVNAAWLLAIIALITPSAVASPAASYNDQRLITSQKDYPTLDPVTALSIEASAVRERALLASTPAIPIPTDDAAHDRLVELAALIPSLHRSSRETSYAPTSKLAKTSPLPARAGFESLETNLYRGQGLQAQKTIVATRNATRIMVVGDSMTQGSEGDWTWRYRMWEWFREQKVKVDFVGPYVGTQEPSPPAPPAPPPLYGAPDPPPGPIRSSGGYAADISSHFASDHFSVWGRAAAVDKGLIQEVMVEHEADLMLLMLGFNDMGWFYSGPEGTIDSIHTLITNARAANPNIKIAVANVPQRRFLGREDLPANTDVYNALLEQKIPRWTTSESPVELVRLRENYECELKGCPAGYDGLHPNALGDYQIAQAFSYTLVNKFKIGHSPLKIPVEIPDRPVSVPTLFKVETSPGGILATWDRVYGTYTYEVRVRIKGVTGWSVGGVGAERYDASWTFNGSVYEMQVRATCGEDIQGDWTEIKSAIAHPQTAPGPANVDIQATATGVDIAFDPPSGPYTDTIIEYQIIYWNKDSSDIFPGAAAFVESPVHIDGLVPGHRYAIAIITWNAAGGGFPQFYREVRIGSRVPSVPANLQVKSTDATTAHLSWDPVPEAAGYRVWSHRIDDNSDPVADNKTLLASSVDIPGLHPGTQYYEFCVSAFNGNVESPHGECVVALSVERNVNIPEPVCSGGTCHMKDCSGLSCINYGLQRILTQWL